MTKQKFEEEAELLVKGHAIIPEIVGQMLDFLIKKIDEQDEVIRQMGETV